MFGFGSKFSINGDEFQKKIDQGGYIVDVRTPSEFKGGHLENAVNIPLAVLPMHLNELYKYSDKGVPILLYCHSGARSAQAYYFLEKNNLKEVYNLKSGILAWHGKIVR